MIRGAYPMIFTVQATYENGVLKLIDPLPLKEHEKVRVTIEPEISWTARTAGILGWQGDVKRFSELLAEAEEPA